MSNDNTLLLQRANAHALVKTFPDLSELFKRYLDTGVIVNADILPVDLDNGPVWSLGVFSKDRDTCIYHATIDDGYFKKFTTFRNEEYARRLNEEKTKTEKESDDTVARQMVITIDRAAVESAFRELFPTLIHLVEPKLDKPNSYLSVNFVSDDRDHNCQRLQVYVCCGSRRDKVVDNPAARAVANDFRQLYNQYYELYSIIIPRYFTPIDRQSDTSKYTMRITGDTDGRHVDVTRHMTKDQFDEIISILM